MPRNWQFSQVPPHGVVGDEVEGRVGQFARLVRRRETLEWLMIAQKLFFVGKATSEFRMNKTLRLEAPILNGFWASRFPARLTVLS